MIKSAEMPKANVLYKAKDYEAVCIRRSKTGEYHIFSLEFDGHAAHYTIMTRGMSIREARELLAELAELKQDISGNLHLMEWQAKDWRYG